MKGKHSGHHHEHESHHDHDGHVAHIHMHKKHGGETREEEHREEERKEHEHRAEGGGLHMREEMDKPEYSAHGGAHHAGHRRPRRAKGGATKVHEYNAVGSPTMKEAASEEEDFKKGGAKHMKRRAGGMAEGHMAEPRADKMPRGRHHRKAGGTVWSTGTRISPPEGAGHDDASRGHEGVKVPEQPREG
jgi:hypothetical protein